MRPPLAAVTGATGFLGPHVLRALDRAGWRLRILARRHPKIEGIREPVSVVPGTLAEPDALARLVSGADSVIHLAGAVKARSRADFMAANAEGAARLAAAWRRAAPGARLVHVSSMAAREPELSHYAASKRAGEARIAEAGGEHVILRPAAVYGPGDIETLAIFRAARLPFQPLLAGPEARVCLIHVDDVASAVVAALAALPGGATCELSDARTEGYAWREIADQASRTLGRTARPVQLPRGLVTALGRIGDVTALLGAGTPMLTSQKTREILHSDWSSDRKNQPAPDIWRPTRSIADGFAETVAWYRRHGYL